MSGYSLFPMRFCSISGESLNVLSLTRPQISLSVIYPSGFLENKFPPLYINVPRQCDQDTERTIRLSRIDVLLNRHPMMKSRRFCSSIYPCRLSNAFGGDPGYLRRFFRGMRFYMIPQFIKPITPSIDKVFFVKALPQ